MLHAREVQSVEAPWRSLAFLASQMDFRKGVRLSVLHAHDGELLERFRTLLIDRVFDDLMIRTADPTNLQRSAGRDFLEGGCENPGAPGLAPAGRTGRSQQQALILSVRRRPSC